MAASDFEKLLLGLVSAGEGFQSRRASDRSLSLRMQDRKLAGRKELREERRGRLEEFEILGAPLDVIEQGEQLSRSPSFRGDLRPRGIRIGAEPRPGEKRSVEAFERFQKRMQSKRGEDETTFFDPGSGKKTVIKGRARVARGPTVAGPMRSSTMLSRIEALNKKSLSRGGDLEDADAAELKRLLTAFRKRIPGDSQEGGAPAPSGRDDPQEPEGPLGRFLRNLRGGAGLGGGSGTPGLRRR